MRLSGPVIDAARLPLALPIATGRLVVRGGSLALRAAAGAARLVADTVTGPGRAPSPPSTSHDAPVDEPSRRVVRTPEATPAPEEVPVATAPPVPEEMKTIDDEPILTAEFADEGAEDGAGPEIRVSEPWDGYDRATAAQLVRALPTETDEALASVRLYENQGKRRRTVLDEADRELRRRVRAADSSSS